MEHKFKNNYLPLALDTFKFSFNWWLFIFIAVMLPLDFIYRASSLFEAMTIGEIALGFAGIVVVYTFVALLIALCSLVLQLPIMLFSDYAKDIFEEINAYIGVIFLTSIFIFYCWQWYKRVFCRVHLFSFSGNIKYNIFYCLLGTLLLLLVLLRKKLLIVNQIKSIALNKLDFIKYLSCLCIVVITVALTTGKIRNTFIQEPPAVASNKINVPNLPYPNIILISFDALRADHCSLYGFHLNTTSNLSAFARESYVFKNMYSSCNWTLPSLSSLLTGKHPLNHSVTTQLSSFQGNSRKRNLPYILKNSLGYRTGQFVANNFGSALWNGLIGFDLNYFYVRQNNIFDLLMKSIFKLQRSTGIWLSWQISDLKIFNIITAYSCIYPPPEEILEEATSFIEDNKQPFFLWIHLIQPHYPYLPRNDFLYSFLSDKILDNLKKLKKEQNEIMINGRYSHHVQTRIDNLALRYDENILYADHELGKFLEYLRKQGYLKNSIIILTSDHGEMFEKGYLGHGSPYLYQSLINVPLIIHLPDQNKGKLINSNISHIDIAPTILDLIGSIVPDWMDGSSFKKSMHGLQTDNCLKFSMNLSYTSDPKDFQSKSIAAIKGSYKLIKYIDFKLYELYNIEKDPSEQNDLVTTEPEIFQSLRKEIDHFLTKVQKSSGN